MNQSSRPLSLRLALVAGAFLVLVSAECPTGGNGNGNGSPPAPTPTTMAIVSGNTQTETVGQQLANPLVVRITDQNGDAMQNQSVSFSVTAGGGSVADASVNTDANGEASTTWTLGTTSGQQTVAATLGSLSQTITATADPDVPASISVNAGDAQQALVDTDVATAPSVLVEDQFGNGVPGVDVTFAVTSGGGGITGAAATTDASGIATVGSWTVGSAAGTNTLSATATGGGITNNPVTVSAEAVATLFDIELRYVAPEPSASQQMAFDDAAAGWEFLLVGELGDQAVDRPAGTCGGANIPAVSETITNLVIYVEVTEIDGPFGVLGQAGPCDIRAGTNFPALGGMFFDSADINRLETDGDLENVVLHEMGHVLGFGTLWSNAGFLQDPSDTSQGGVGDADTHFTGPRALVVFDSLGGAGYIGNKAPVENDTSVFGTGSLDGHWREGVMDTELMTPLLDAGVTNELSALTVASQEDLGYQVNTGGADGYVLPGPPALVAGPRRVIDLRGDVWRGPIRFLDARGRVTAVLWRRR